jgi:hypothetical protein
MNLLNQRCTIERATITKNAQKQTIKTWATIASNVHCNIQYNTVSRNSMNNGGTGFVTEGQYIGFFAPDQSVLKGDKITWNNINLFVDGVPFPVFASANSIHHLEALLAIEES